MCLSSIFDYFVHFSPHLLKLDIGSDIICCKSILYAQVIITEYITVNSLYCLKMYFNLFCESIDMHSINFDFESFSPIYFLYFLILPISLPVFEIDVFLESSM